MNSLIDILMGKKLEKTTRQKCPECGGHIEPRRIVCVECSYLSQLEACLEQRKLMKIYPGKMDCPFCGSPLNKCRIESQPFINVFMHVKYFLTNQAFEVFACSAIRS